MSDEALGFLGGEIRGVKEPSPRAPSTQTPRPHVPGWARSVPCSLSGPRLGCPSRPAWPRVGHGCSRARGADVGLGCGKCVTPLPERPDYDKPEKGARRVSGRPRTPPTSGQGWCSPRGGGSGPRTAPPPPPSHWDALMHSGEPLGSPARRGPHGAAGRPPLRRGFGESPPRAGRSELAGGGRAGEGGCWRAEAQGVGGGWASATAAPS